MIPGLIAYDVLFAIAAALLYGPAAYLALEVWQRIAARTYWALGIVPTFVTFAVALIIEVAALGALLPRLRPGRYALMKHPIFFVWLVRSMLRRLLFAPGLKWFLFASNTLRFFSLRALGARVAFDANMSADVDILDPWLLTAESGATIGARAMLASHYVERGELVLGPVFVGKGALVASEVLVGPSVSIGARAVVKPLASLSVGVTVGEGAQIGPSAFIDHGVQIGKGAIVHTRVHVKRKQIVADYEEVSSSS
jgi:acetyltransferase-like isoleucine patch superfamily enzyme